MSEIDNKTKGCIGKIDEKGETMKGMKYKFINNGTLAAEHITVERQIGWIFKEPHEQFVANKSNNYIKEQKDWKKYSKSVI